MCGIVGYVGRQKAEPILVEGLPRLEYPAYDSAGLATLKDSTLHLRKRSGRISDLVRHLHDRPAPGCHGISHTRWATHGPATDANAPPHVGGADLVAVVHNGVIENDAELKSRLRSDGAAFQSDTDTEVIAHLIARHFKTDGLNHGPIALVDQHTPSVVLAPPSAVFDKVMSNLEEIKAGHGPVIAVASVGDTQVAARRDEVIWLPEAPEYLQPVLAAVPLQLLAYEIAVLRGCDVDKPRNLAKSVTVE
jgi:glucosamine 6-phosphate synthetase-like amidotransferase/phosphosugar isomerase protein